jgi:hypothetical protein
VCGLDTVPEGGIPVTEWSCRSLILRAAFNEASCHTVPLSAQESLDSMTSSHFRQAVEESNLQVKYPFITGNSQASCSFQGLNQGSRRGRRKHVIKSHNRRILN